MNERSIEDLRHTAKYCTTHHAACDCRELKYRELIRIMGEALLSIATFTPNDTDYPTPPTRNDCLKEIRWEALTALGDMAGILIEEEDTHGTKKS